MDFTRESIFVGAIRSFCTALATILGIGLAIGIMGIGLALIIGPNYMPPKATPLILPDVEGGRKMLPGNSPAILQIKCHGMIGIGDLTSQSIKALLWESREDFLRGDRVKAILLHINTPGGASTDADDIYNSLMEYKTKYKVPIYAYVEGMCASGGMYIACAADKIFASPSSVIGSVGVRLGPIFNFSEVMTKVGVSSLTLTDGKDKDALNPFRPWRPNEDADLKDVMEALYDRFISIVTAARPNLSKEKLIDDYGAHLFISKKAEELGYIDVGDSSYTQALSGLVDSAGLQHTKYQVVQLTPYHPFFSSLAQSMSPHKFLQGLGLSTPANNPDLSGKLLYLYP